MIALNLPDFVSPRIRELVFHKGRVKPRFIGGSFTGLVYAP